MNFRSLVPALALALLSGCAATVQRAPADAAMATLPRGAADRLVLNVAGSAASVSAGDWSGFKQEWQENFAEQCRLQGVPFEWQEGAARPTGQSGTLVVVQVDDYRFIRPGARYGLGVMTGNAYIQSKLTYRDLNSGTTWGSKSANTSSSAWEGVFSAMTNKQVEAIAVDVLKDLKSGR